MPIFTMEIDKRAVMAFSGNYSLKADWDQVLFFNMLKRDLRESLFDSRTGAPIWDGTTPITVRLATPAEVQTWSDSPVAEERDGTIEPADYDEWAAYLVPVRSRRPRRQIPIMANDTYNGAHVEVIDPLAERIIDAMDDEAASDDERILALLNVLEYTIGP